MQITGRLKEKHDENKRFIHEGFYAIAEPVEALSINEMALKKNMIVIKLSAELTIDSFDK
jgi:hypothetical protein